MIFACAAEVIVEQRGTGRYLNTLRVFTVKYPQGVPGKTSHAIFTKVVLFSLKILDEDIPEWSSALLAADTVDLRCHWRT